MKDRIIQQKRLFKYFDFTLTLLTFGLLSIGLIFVFSSTYSNSITFSIFFKKQLIGAMCGIFIYLFFSLSDFKNLSRLGFLAYFLVLFLLGYTIIAGLLGMGARRWISLYFFRAQPSEAAKLFLPAAISYHFFGEQEKKIEFKNFLYPIFILFMSFLLIVKQPDLGTALLILISGFLLLWIIGLNKKFFIIGALCTLIGAPILWQFLKPYQQNRILVLLGSGDARNEGYQIEQSKIAIGSGGLFGKGFLGGTQNKLGFLPEDHTDFIFSVICEEIGFIGALFILLIFACLFLRIFLIIFALNNNLYKFICLGLVLHMLLSLLINIGMVIGLLPIVGIPLPLFTYGISNLWVNLASIGWINNASIRKLHLKH